MSSNIKEYQNRFNSFQYYSRKILMPVLKNPKFNFLYTIVKNWKEIVGNKYENYCKVEKVTLTNENKQGNVYVISYNSSTSFYLNNNKDYIIEKLNSIFGYKAIINLFIKEIPMHVNTEKKIVRIEVNAEKRDKVEKIVLKIRNDNLKRSLLELGIGIDN